jgi:hypothetical protein
MRNRHRPDADDSKNHDGMDISLLFADALSPKRATYSMSGVYSVSVEVQVWPTNASRRDLL